MGRKKCQSIIFQFETAKLSKKLNKEKMMKEKEIPHSLYFYRAKIIKVYDGDTVTASIDLGFHAWIMKEKLRLKRINTPEVRGDEREEGLKSRDWLREKILDKEVVIKTYKDKKGKYGRYLAEIYLDGININDALVENGYAEYKEY